jgi:hypothetical protein
MDPLPYPLTFTNMDATQRQLFTQGLWAVAMWGPGIAAIVTILFVEKNISVVCS